MTEIVYNWKRYWHLSDVQAPQLESGFLHVPDEYSHLFIQNGKQFFTFEEIGDRQCLILLGEPGMGKSRALQDAFDRLVQE